MTKRMLTSLLALNLILFGARLLVNPAPVVAQGDFLSAAEGQFDCCKSSNGGANFCCDQCCSDKEGCDTDGDCGGDIEVQ